MTTMPTVLGILGGGQLGRMLALAAIRMGVAVRFLAPEDEGGVRGLGEATFADWTCPDVLGAWAEGCTAVTVESEWAPADVLAAAAPGLRLYPSPACLAVIRDKGAQKTALQAAGLPTPAFVLVDALAGAAAAARALGYPVLLKRRWGSYDGYGNATAHDEASLEAGWARLGGEGLMLEAFAPFVRELSVLVCRTDAGARVVYPVLETVQRDHRCHSVVAPAPVAEATAQEAVRVASAAVEAVGGVGNVAVELFEMEDGRILINEMAPRPHNTGHLTIEACYTSQFENHVRAVLGWPLGSPELRTPAAAMVNIIGRRSGPADASALAGALGAPYASVHLYGKARSRPRRKMGHVTATASTTAEALRIAEEAAALAQL